MKKYLTTVFLTCALTGLLMTSCTPSDNNATQTGTTETTETAVTPEAKAEDQESKAATASTDKINLKIMWWGPENRHVATQAVLDQYTKLNPNISFTPEFLSWDGYWQKLTVLAASNTLPDVLQMDAAYIQNYVKRNQLADVSSVDLNGIVDPQIIENIKIDGKLYGIPLGRNGGGMVYNKVDLEAAGITLPAAEWTWDDFFAFAEEGRSKLPKDKFPIGDPTNSWDSYQMYQTSMGKGPIFVDGTKLNLDKDLWFAFQTKFEQYRQDGVVPSAAESVSFKENDATADPMASLKVMTRGASVGSVGALQSLMPEKDIQVVNNPYGPEGGGWSQSTIFFSVGENSAYKQEAKDFERWFISDLDAGKTLTTVRGIPISAEVFTAIEPELTPENVIGKKLLDVTAIHPQPFYPCPPDWTDWATEYKATMESVMFGETTIEKAYDKLTKLGLDVEAGISK